jgi:ribosomal protein uL24
MVINSSLALKEKQLSTPLSPELRDEHGIRRLPIRKGDTVQVKRGLHKGVEGAVTEVKTKEAVIHIEGVTREKADGSVIFIPLRPSKVCIIKLNLEDSRRKDIMERRRSRRSLSR